MISNQILQATLDGLKAIARVDLAVTDPEGRTVVSTGEIPGLLRDAGEFASSGADSQEIKGNQYFKIYDDQSLEYVLAVAGAGARPPAGILPHTGQKRRRNSRNQR